jgi:hypothetical protein
VTESIDIKKLLADLDRALPSKRKVSAAKRKQQNKNMCRYCGEGEIVKHNRCSKCLPDHEAWLKRNNAKKPPKESSQGYIYAYDADGNYGLLHRQTMEKVLGRPLMNHESVRFKDGDKSNCDPSNLVLVLKNGVPLAELVCPCCNTPYLEATSISGPPDFVTSATQQMSEASSLNTVPSEERPSTNGQTLGLSL